MPVAAYLFTISFVLPLLVAMSATYGGWWLAATPIYAWFVTSLLDRLVGHNTSNPDPNTSVSALFWHRVVTLAWLPLQLACIGYCLFAVAEGRLTTAEFIYLGIGLGVATGGIGITYAHELIHQKNRLERAAGEVLLCSVAYGHFATEHVLNHHRYVATPKDPVTARYNEGFWVFFPRALWGSARSAWEIDADRQRRRGKPLFGLENPWWRYLGLTGVFALIAYLIAGWAGVGFFLLQSFFAVLQLEAVNYVEHYGLTRKHLGDGRYEHTKPRHSWNAPHAVTNLILINLQRHSDHHYKPDRRFPLLQTYDEDDAPQLPFGYPLMLFFAFNPPLWFRIMNKRVKAWRKKHYPEITDWSLYKTGLTPLPR